MKFKPAAHIVGKVYDLTQENMNAMIAEIEALTAGIDDVLDGHRDIARDPQEAARCWQIERAELTKQLEAAQALVTVLKLERHMETIANTKTMFHGTEIIKRYEAAEAENARLRAALEKIRDTGLCASSNPDKCCHFIAKAALVEKETT